MKRSEMISKLEDILYNRGLVRIEKCGCHTCEPDEFDADYILTELENLGMSPPFGSKIKQIDIVDRWGVDTGRDELARVIVNEWESEDG